MHLRRGIWIFLCLGFLLLLFVIALRVLNGPLMDWNARRLVGSIGLAYGQRIFSPPDDLLMISGVNGPVALVAYLPSALASSPTAAIRMGVFLSLFYFFASSFVLLLAIRRRSEPLTDSGRVLFYAVFLCFGFLAFRSRALSASSTFIHADAPAIALSALACAFLLWKKSRTLTFDLLTASAAVLAFFSKITFLPLLVALPLYVFFSEGWKKSLRLIGCVVVSVVFFGAIFNFFFGLKNLYFINWPASSYWVKTLDVVSDGYALDLQSKARVLGSALLEIMREYSILLLCLFGYLSLSLYQRAIRSYFWLFPFAISVLMLPPSLLGRVKAGGDINTQSPTVYFLVLAFCVFLWEVGKETKGRALLAGVLLLLVALQVKNLDRWTAPLKAVQVDYHETSYQFAKSHPGEVYYPEYPLSNLMAEKRIYHSGALLCEFISQGFQFSDENLKAHLPKNMRWIAYQSSQPFEPLQQLVPQFSQEVKLQELPGWLVLTKKSG